MFKLSALNLKRRDYVNVSEMHESKHSTSILV